MFIKIIYILFIAVADFFLFSMLNKTSKVKSSLLWSFWTLFSFVFLLHIGLFKLDFLMPFDHFFMVIQFLIELVIFHYVGKYYINKTKRSTRLTPEVSGFAANMASFIFLKAIYIFVFLVQSIFILTDNYQP
jgi:hypothetical protein